jgi:hypothetical protein
MRFRATSPSHGKAFYNGKGRRGGWATGGDGGDVCRGYTLATPGIEIRGAGVRGATPWLRGATPRIESLQRDSTLPMMELMRVRTVRISIQIGGIGNVHACMYEVGEDKHMIVYIHIHIHIRFGIAGPMLLICLTSLAARMVTRIGTIGILKDRAPLCCEPIVHTYFQYIHNSRLA